MTLQLLEAATHSPHRSHSNTTCNLTPQPLFYSLALIFIAHAALVHLTLIPLKDTVVTVAQMY
jgi:hypothetical protein